MRRFVVVLSVTVEVDAENEEEAVDVAEQYVWENDVLFDADASVTEVVYIHD